MSKRRSARAGRNFWAALNRSPRHQRYSSKRMEINVGPASMDQNILGAALAAAEAINASVQIVPDSEKHPVAEDPQGIAESSVPVQPEISEDAEEGSEIEETICEGCGVMGDCVCWDPRAEEEL